MLPNPYTLGGPQKREQNHNWLPHSSLLRGPKEGGNALLPMFPRGYPEEGTKSKLTTPPLPPRGPTSGWKCYVTPVFSGVPRRGEKIRIGYLKPAFFGAQKRAELPRNRCVFRDPQSKGKKTGLVYLSPAFSGVHKWAEMQRNPCVLGGPEKRGQNQNWLDESSLLGAHE